jgi:hypothetical protein
MGPCVRKKKFITLQLYGIYYTQAPDNAARSRFRRPLFRRRRTRYNQEAPFHAYLLILDLGVPNSMEQIGEVLGLLKIRYLKMRYLF